MILETLSEIENKTEFSPQTSIKLPISEKNIDILYQIREKTLVLFEGLQSSQTKDIGVKLDLVINYLQYQLSIIDELLGD